MIIFGKSRRGACNSLNAPSAGSLVAQTQTRQKLLPRCMKDGQRKSIELTFLDTHSTHRHSLFFKEGDCVANSVFHTLHPTIGSTHWVPSGYVIMVVSGALANDTVHPYISTIILLKTKPRILEHCPGRAYVIVLAWPSIKSIALQGWSLADFWNCFV